ncbi:MAG: protein kinase [Labilithrix sp.]
MEKSDTLDIGAVIGGRYRVTGEIGRGGMGVVYRVEHVHTGESLALKVLLGGARFDPQAVARFKREARASTQIRSEHVVRVTDADTAPELDGSPFFVMELLRGIDLEEYVHLHGPIAIPELVPLLAQITSALHLAHGLGIVHRDLKPGNLFLHERLDGTTVAKVLDFGISKFITAKEQMETAGMTSTGSVLGTPLYMAPEQAHGHNDKIAPTTDVWAVGLITMKLMTAESYWGEPTMAELMMKIAVKDIIAPSKRWPGRADMTPALDAWFARSVAREQESRYASVEEQMRDLAAALEQPMPTSARPAALPRLDAPVKFAPAAPLFTGGEAADSARITDTATADTELVAPLLKPPASESLRKPSTPKLESVSALARSASRPSPEAPVASGGRARTFLLGGLGVALAGGVALASSWGSSSPPVVPAASTSTLAPPSAPPALAEAPEPAAPSRTAATPIVSASAVVSAAVALKAPPPPRPKPVVSAAAPSAAPVASRYEPAAP